MLNGIQAVQHHHVDNYFVQLNPADFDPIAKRSIVMQPTALSWSVYDAGEPWGIRVLGPRVLKSGEHGVQVGMREWDFKDGWPRWVFDVIRDAMEAVRRDDA